MGIAFKEETLLDLIAGAYDAALGAEDWKPFLKALGAATGARSIMFHIYDSETETVRFYAAAGVAEAYRHSYVGRYARVSPWLRALDEAEEGTVACSRTLVPNRELAQTEFFRRWLRPQGLFHGMCAVIRRAGPESAVLELLRPRADGPFSAAARTCLGKIVPQMRRALTIHERFATLDVARLAFGDALDCLKVGVILVDRRGRVSFMNRQAARLVALDDGLTIVGDTLSAASMKETAHLRQFVGRAIAADAAAEAASGASMTLSRPSLRRPFSVAVIPIRPTGGRFPAGTAGDGPAAALIVTDPEREFALPEADIARLYGLTPAEAGILMALVNGRNLAEIAAQRQISKNTVRSHLQRIFDKTETSRQAELVKLVLSGPAVVDSGGGPET